MIPPITEQDRDDLKLLIEQGATVTEAAERLGWTRRRVYIVADKFGIKVRDFDRVVIKSIADVVADMRSADAIAFLIEAYHNLSGEDGEREAQLVVDHRFSPCGAKIFAVLEAAPYVSRERLTTILEAAGYQGDSLTVHVSQLRKAIRTADLPFTIANVWGGGYALRALSDGSPAT